MNDEILSRVGSRFRELLSIYKKRIGWRIGREGNTIFICYLDVSIDSWVYIGTIDEILSLSVHQLNDLLRKLYTTRPTIWFPRSEWKNGIGEDEIEEYYGRMDYPLNRHKKEKQIIPEDDKEYDHCIITEDAVFEALRRNGIPFIHKHRYWWYVKLHLPHNRPIQLKDGTRLYVRGTALCASNVAPWEKEGWKKRHVR